MTCRNLAIAVFTLSACLTALPGVEAMETGHPVRLYEKGKAMLDGYRGDSAVLQEAQNVFLQIVAKYPESPLGYLGLSRLKLIEACRYGRHYNMPMIKEEAMPFAVKALERGTLIPEIHTHYSFYEKIFEEYNARRKRVQNYLDLFPGKPKTYFLVANLIADQNDFEKALKYYLAALELGADKALRLKILQRVAWIYLEIYRQPERAVSYSREALEIQPGLAGVNELLGIAYLRLKDYDQAAERLSLAFEKGKTPYAEYYLMQAKSLVYERDGLLDKAIGALEKIWHYRREDPELNYRLGNLYFKAENYRSAYRYFQNVIDRGPSNPAAYYFAGRSADSIGESGKALDLYGRYLKLDTTSQEADWIRRNIPAFFGP